MQGFGVAAGNKIFQRRRRGRLDVEQELLHFR
jgi:hypothetical protein